MTEHWPQCIQDAEQKDTGSLSFNERKIDEGILRSQNDLHTPILLSFEGNHILPSFSSL